MLSIHFEKCQFDSRTREEVETAAPCDSAEREAGGGGHALFLPLSTGEERPALSDCEV
jgi:hypothetical protein